MVPHAHVHIICYIATLQLLKYDVGINIYGTVRFIRCVHILHKSLYRSIIVYIKKIGNPLNYTICIPQPLLVYRNKCRKFVILLFFRFWFLSLCYKRPNVERCGWLTDEYYYRIFVLQAIIIFEKVRNKLLCFIII